MSLMLLLIGELDGSSAVLRSIPAIQSSSADYVPSQIFDAHFISCLLIVVEPFSLSQFYTLKLGVGLEPVNEPLPLEQFLSVIYVHHIYQKMVTTNLWNKLCKLQAAAVELENLLRLGRLRLRVRCWGRFDGC